MKFADERFTINAYLFNGIVDSVRKYGNRPNQNATDEDVDWFVATFLKKKVTINDDISSYTLKHLCERMVGRYRYDGKTYAYTTHDQLKEAMKRAKYKVSCTPCSKNEYYNFAFVKGADILMEG